MIVDLAIVAFTGAFVWVGQRRGLVNAVAGLAGFLGATAAAVFGYRVAAAPIQGAFKIGRGMANLIGMLAIFSAVLLLGWLGGRELTRLLRWTKWGWVNRAAGGALGALWALAWASVIVLALSVVPVPETVGSQLERSSLAQGIVEESPRVMRAIARTDLRKLITSFLPSGEPEVTIRPTTDFAHSPGAERSMFDLANEERRARGLPALRWDDRLALVARQHASDMYLRGFFSHTNPDGLGPADRLERADVPFSLVAENLALAPSATIAHNRLMGSEEHRREILGERFTRIGVGVMFGRQGILVTQEFAA